MKVLLLTTILLLASCAPSVPQEYTLTCTKDKLIGPDEVQVYERVLLVEKKGWLTSDRYHIHIAGGKLIVLNGKWKMEVETK